MIISGNIYFRLEIKYMDLKLNERTFKEIEGLMEKYGFETIDYQFDHGEVRILDVGVDTEVADRDAWIIGERISEASMGTLGEVKLRNDSVFVNIKQYPSIATLSCQMAGWAVKIDSNTALGSGPVRIPARKPNSVINKIGYHEDSENGVLVLETDRTPTKIPCREMLDESNVNELVIITFRGNTPIGLMNIMARIVEVGIYRLEKIGYDVNRILSAKGSVPIPELDKDVMFTSNDAIIYSGEVFLEVSEWNSELTEKAISRASKFYGRNFKEIFNDVGGDFYKIDPDIFAPARLKVRDLDNNKEYESGEVR
ncbi:MAG TPA: hypothetical protein EYP86_04950 [Candidatus Altiarchaeales archaeon]|nr:hypothetical protein [Candidatus Altiarchaeales archaeon]